MSGVCSCLCTVFLVIANILGILHGLFLLLLGILITAGFKWLESLGILKPILDYISDLLKKLINQDINVSEILQNLTSLTSSAGIALIVIGLVLVVLCCTGCIGGSCRKRACLLVYAVLVGLICLGQLIVIIIWYADSNIMKSSAKTAMEGSVSRYKGFKNNHFESLLMDLMQMLLSCCGANNGTDYNILNNHWDRQLYLNQGGRNFTFNLTYPVSCCQFDLAAMRPVNPLCPYNNTDSNYKRGCYDALFRDYIDKYFLNFLFPSLAGVLALQILLVIGAIVIYQAIPNTSGAVHDLSVSKVA